jgi:hypothetical protein
MLDGSTRRPSRAANTATFTPLPRVPGARVPTTIPTPTIVRRRIVYRALVVPGARVLRRPLSTHRLR